MVTVRFDFDVFLSHASVDAAAVRELAQRLKADGLRVWLDEWVIQPGDLIPQAIEDGLESSRTLVLVMSQAAFDSEWVTLERHRVLFRDPTNRQRRFIPLRLDDCEIKESLKPYAYVDWRDRSNEEYERLVAASRPLIDKPTVTEGGTLDDVVSVSEMVEAHDVVKSLQNGWSSDRYSFVMSAISTFTLMFKQIPKQLRIADDFACFTVDLLELRLRGIGDETPFIFLFLAGGSKEPWDLAKKTVNGKTRRLHVICCCSEEAFEQAQAKSGRFCVVLSPSQLESMLSESNPREVIRLAALMQIGVLRLCPYSISGLAEGNMFFDRKKELRDLVEDEESNYAIVGPSGIGKSSLLRRYLWELMREKNPRRLRVYFVDLLAANVDDPDAFSSHIAKAIDESPSTSSMKLANLSSFLERKAADAGGSLELIIDECDLLFGTAGFEHLGEIAKRGIIRVVMAGRERFEDNLKSSKYRFSERVRMLKLGPLDDESAGDLIVKPLRDLGFTLGNELELARRVLNLTGGNPFRIQSWALDVVREAIHKNANEITLDAVP